MQSKHLAMSLLMSIMVIEYNLFAHEVNGAAAQSSLSLAIMDVPSPFCAWQKTH